MPEITGLRPDDPAEVGGYALTGRLGESAFVGRAGDGATVVVKLLHPGMDVARLVRAVEPLQGITAFSTARVLATGALDDRPYVVSEYIDGPDLEEAGGTLRDVALHRLAVGTMTALVAIHQAGVVHGDLRPGNVVLGPDGPRVINVGVAGAMQATSTTATRKVEIPAFTAPERLDGTPAAAPGDVFSWAATMAFAASGRSPFEGGSMTGTVNRIVNDEPDLPDLGELRELIAMCLAKDPAERPAASEVLLRLVGQTSFLSGIVGPTPGSTKPESAARPRRGGLLLGLVAAFLVGALVSGAGVYALTGDRPIPVAAGPVTPSPNPAIITADPKISSLTTVAPLEPVEKKATKDTELSDIGLTLHEHPKDQTRLMGYVKSEPDFGTHVRNASGEFTRVGTGEEPSVSPDGAWVALNPWLKFQESDLDQIKFQNLRTGEKFTVTTVKKPLSNLTPVWSRDSTRLLLSVIDDKKPRRVVGFVVVDLRTRKAVHVETEYNDDASMAFTFTPDGTIARGYWDGERNGIEFYDLGGKVTRTLHWVGTPRARDWYTPSGTQFLTVCPEGGDLCVWDARTGDRKATVRVKGDAQVLGFFNENHILLQRAAKKKGKEEVVIIDLVGKFVRVLADVTAERAFVQFAPVAR
ncbi:WD40 repeat domain-containing serine/threonine protein kinase [Streptosporangium sp. KLBMP 9127]|nr:protein kinase [Streptosporangium sp. KLBMP 9127]